MQKLLAVKSLNLLQVKEKRAEVDKLKTMFVRRASEFLRNYFSSLVDFMMSDKSYFSQVYRSVLLELIVVSFPKIVI